MATVVSITNPITGVVEQVDKLDHTAQQIDDAVALAPQLSNQNLLANWYFGNPVNQREFSGENTNGGYFIDRWLGYNCSYVNGVIKIKKGMFDSSAKGYIIQRIDSHFSDKLNGMVCTFSALVDGDLISGMTVYSNTSEVTYAIKNGVRLYTQIVNGLVELVTVTDETTEKAISAVKLELGTTQTLAHQENGNWVLNEIPDYGEQLRRCQRYYYRLSANNTSKWARFGAGMVDAYGRAEVYLFIPPMRCVPSVSLNGTFCMTVGELNETIDGSNLSNVDDNATNSAIVLRMSGSYTSGLSTSIQAGNDATAYIEFTANL